jgi:hypothetical protein
MNNWWRRSPRKEHGWPCPVAVAWSWVHTPTRDQPLPMHDPRGRRIGWSPVTSRWSQHSPVECNQPCHLFWLDSLSVINKAALDPDGIDDLGLTIIQRTTWIHVSSLCRGDSWANPDGIHEPTRIPSCESPGIGRIHYLPGYRNIRTIKTVFRFDGCFHLTLRCLGEG